MKKKLYNYSTPVSEFLLVNDGLTAPQHTLCTAVSHSKEYFIFLSRDRAEG